MVECLLEILCFNLGRPWRIMHSSLQTDTLAVLIHTKHAQADNECYLTVKSEFLSRITMYNIVPKLQKCWTHKIM